MLTGMRPNTTRVTNNEDNLYKNIPGVLTLPHLFRQHGYATARCGKIFHLGVPTGLESMDDPQAWDFGTELVQMPLDRWSDAFDQLFAVNVKGCLLGARASIDALRESSGSMIFTLSNGAFHAGGGGPLYIASKHALRGLIAQLAWELDNQVRVNGVAPGAMSTDLGGLPAFDQAHISLRNVIDSLGGVAAFASAIGRPFVPEASDYVSAYVLLASHESRNTTGAVFEMHGMLGTPPRPPG